MERDSSAQDAEYEELLRTDVTVRTTGRAHQVFIGERFTGFTLFVAEPLPDDEVLRLYNESDIIIEDELSYGGNYSFPDIDLRVMIHFGAERVVCESFSDPEGDSDGDLVVYLRVVKAGYDPAQEYIGFGEIIAEEP